MRRRDRALSLERVTPEEPEQILKTGVTKRTSHTSRKHAYAQIHSPKHTLTLPMPSTLDMLIHLLLFHTSKNRSLM